MAQYWATINAMPLRYQEIHYLNQIAQNDSPVSVRATTTSLQIVSYMFMGSSVEGEHGLVAMRVALVDCRLISLDNMVDLTAGYADSCSRYYADR